MSRAPRMSGILAVETADGHQSWAMIVDAEVRYDNDVEFASAADGPHYTVIAELPPGEWLRTANTVESGEENVLVYSRLLVATLREERDRYAELEKELGVWRRTAQDLREQADDAERKHAEELHEAWRDGVKGGYSGHRGGWTMGDALRMNPHPLPDDEDGEPGGCHVCGGPDH